MSHSSVDPCQSCERFVRVEDTHCPFCGAPHAGEAPRRTPLRSRLAHVIGAALLVSACGGGEATEDTSGGGGGGDGSGGEVVEGDTQVPDGESGGGGEGEGVVGGGLEAEPNCAGTCGSHHHPACMDEDPPCPAPPYGAPPFEDLLV